MQNSTLPEWLAKALASLQNGDVEGWMKIYRSDAVHEFPFAPENAPRRVEGRDAIAAYMRGVCETVTFGPLGDVSVREAGTITIVEAIGHHRRRSDGTPQDLAFVWIIERAGDEVVRYRDYMNPQQLMSF